LEWPISEVEITKRVARYCLSQNSYQARRNCNGHTDQTGETQSYSCLQF